jgi:DNA-binding response OmpR family regulator
LLLGGVLPVENQLPCAERATKRILIAEDDALIGILLEETFGGVAGWSAHAVPDGRTLLGAAAAAPPDLVLLDVDLPGLDGIAVYRLLRKRAATRTVPVLFVTSGPERIERARLAGDFAIQAKPFRIALLLARVTGMLGQPAPAR